MAASKISKNKFEVHVQGGVATLTGRTDVLQHKGTATRLARNGGALRVVNRIEVSEAAKEKAASNLDSGRRRAQVKRSEISSRKYMTVGQPRGLPHGGSRKELEWYNREIRAKGLS